MGLLLKQHNGAPVSIHWPPVPIHWAPVSINWAPVSIHWASVWINWEPVSINWAPISIRCITKVSTKPIFTLRLGSSSAVLQWNLLWLPAKILFVHTPPFPRNTRLYFPVSLLLLHTSYRSKSAPLRSPQSGRLGFDSHEMIFSVDIPIMALEAIKFY